MITLSPEIVRAIAARAREIAHMSCKRCTGGSPGAVMLADANERYHSTKCDALTNVIADGMATMATLAAQDARSKQAPAREGSDD